MARQKKTPAVDLSIFAKAAEEMGMDFELDEEVKEQIDDASLHRPDNSPTLRQNTGESILWEIDHLGYATPEFIFVTCRREGCGQVFRTNYRYNRYCSFYCTEKDLKEKYGIVHHPDKPIEERWGWQRERYNIPLTYTPSALRAVEEFARQFLADLDKFRASQAERQAHPESKTRYLWEDRGLSQEKLDEFYPHQEAEVPANQSPQTQEIPDQSSAESLTDEDDLFAGLLD